MPLKNLVYLKKSGTQAKRLVYQYNVTGQVIPVWQYSFSYRYYRYISIPVLNSPRWQI